MKKIYSILLVAILVFTLSACGGENAKEGETTNKGKQTENQAENQGEAKEDKEAQTEEKSDKEGNEAQTEEKSDKEGNEAQTEEKSDKEGNETKTEEESTKENTDNKSENDSDKEKAGKDDKEKKMENKNLPIAVISTSLGGEKLEDIKIQLRPDVAENTVNNFIKLSNDGYYNGLIFHRIIANFMIQGGDPTGTGMGGPGYGIKGEFSQNGVENNLLHERGVISMARSQAPDSAGSQFFICHADAPFLDGAYAAFGTLISGEDSLDKLATVKTGQQDRPEVECKIEGIKIELNGYTAKDPVVIKE